MIPHITIGFGLLLTALAVIGYGYSTSDNPVTALIPAFVGVPLMLLGILAIARPGARKHAMHVAAMLALLGFLAAVGGFARNPGPLNTLSRAMIVSMGMSCLVLLVLYIRSFIDARRNRTGAPVE